MFKMRSKPTHHTEYTEPYVYSVNEMFINLNVNINEAYTEYINTDIICNECYLNARINNINETSMQLLNEGIISTIYNGTVNFFRKIKNFITDLIGKLDLFIKSMTSYTSKWIDNVASEVERRAKDADILSKIKFEGYKWDIPFISDGIRKNLKMYEEYPVGASKITGGPLKMTTEFDMVIDTALEKAKENKAKQEEANKAKESNTEEGGKSSTEFNAPAIPDKPAEDNSTGNISGVDKNLVEEKEKELHKLFGDKYNEDVIKKAKGGSVEKTTFTNIASAMITKRLDFIRGSGDILTKIKEDYIATGNNYDKIIDAFESQKEDVELSTEDKDKISALISLIKSVNATSNTINRLNISLVEECTKEYINHCNTLLKYKPGKSNSTATTEKK